MTALPAELRPLSQFLRVADEFEEREPAVSYWCRLHALQLGMRLDQSPACHAVLSQVMDKLETIKRAHSEDDLFSQQLQALAYLESLALNVFRWADGEDRGARANRAVVKAFYTCSVLLDVCMALEEDAEAQAALKQRSTYAKWKATYINQCLKEGRQPVPGQAAGETGDDLPPQDAASPGVPLPGSSAAIYPSDPDPAALGFGASASSAGVRGPTSDGFGAAASLSAGTGVPSFPAVGTDASSFSGYGTGASSTGASTGPPSFAGADTGASSLSSSTSAGPSVSQSMPFDVVTKAQRCCKHAACALDYGDIKTAVDNLRTALSLLNTTG